MNSELSNHVPESETRPKCTILSQKILSDLCRSPKILVQPLGPRKDLAKSLNMALFIIFTLCGIKRNP